MKNTQMLQSISVVLCFLFLLGAVTMSCSSKKEQQLPTIGKSVASILLILCRVKTIFIILSYRAGIPIPVFVPMEEVTTFWLHRHLRIIPVFLFSIAGTW